MTNRLHSITSKAVARQNKHKRANSGTFYSEKKLINSAKISKAYHVNFGKLCLCTSFCLGVETFLLND